MSKNIARSVSSTLTQTPQVSQGESTEVNISATVTQTPSLTMDVVIAPFRRIGEVVTKVAALSRVGRVFSSLKKR